MSRPEAPAGAGAASIDSTGDATDLGRPAGGRLGEVAAVFLRLGLTAAAGRRRTSPSCATSWCAGGQFTPGPVLPMPAFVGYRVASLPGAPLATAAIFRPAFGFVARLVAG